MFRAHRVNVKKRYDIRFVIVNMFNAPVITGRVHTYPDIFENGFFSPPFSKKKNKRPHVARSNRFRPST